MDSFGSSTSGSTAAQPNPEAIMDQVKNQLAQAYAEEFLEVFSHFFLKKSLNILVNVCWN